MKKGNIGNVGNTKGLQLYIGKLKESTSCGSWKIFFKQ